MQFLGAILFLVAAFFMFAAGIGSAALTTPPDRFKRLDHASLLRGTRAAVFLAWIAYVGGIALIYL